MALEPPFRFDAFYLHVGFLNPPYDLALFVVGRVLNDKLVAKACEQNLELEPRVFNHHGTNIISTTVLHSFYVLLIACFHLIEEFGFNFLESRILRIIWSIIRNLLDPKLLMCCEAVFRIRAHDSWVGEFLCQRPYICFS